MNVKSDHSPVTEADIESDKIIDIDTKNELMYNKESIINNFFIASMNDLFFI